MEKKIASLHKAMVNSCISFIFLFSLVMFNGCSKNTPFIPINEEATIKAGLIGEWEMTKGTMDTVLQDLFCFNGVYSFPISMVLRPSFFKLTFFEDHSYKRSYSLKWYPTQFQYTCDGVTYEYPETVISPDLEGEDTGGFDVSFSSEPIYIVQNGLYLVSDSIIGINKIYFNSLDNPFVAQPLRQTFPFASNYRGGEYLDLVFPANRFGASNSENTLTIFLTKK
jgi:hypothetical protein